MQSKLEIINGVLQALNEPTLPSLENVGTNHTISTIKGFLERITNQVLSRGYWFNTESITLTPSVSNEIILPQNTLSINSGQYIKKSGKLYNKVGNTYEFPEAITLTLILDISYSDMPSVAYYYISDLVALKALDALDGDPTAISLTQQAIKESRLALNSEEIKNSNLTLLSIQEIQAIRSKL